MGHGSIGKALEKRLLPFGANVSGIARTAREGVHSMAGKNSQTTVQDEYTFCYIEPFLSSPARKEQAVDHVDLLEAQSVHAELNALLPKADIVVILVPLTPETHHLVDARFLATMKRGAMLVNAGR